MAGEGHRAPAAPYCSAAFTFSRPALAHCSSLPGEPATPTPPITSLPSLIGTPPSSDVMFGSSNCCAPRRAVRQFLREVGRGDREGARGVGLAARGLHGVRPGVVVAGGDDGVAAAAYDHDGRAGEAERPAGVDRTSRDGECDRIRHVAPLHELLGRGCVGDRRCKWAAAINTSEYADHGGPHGGRRSVTRHCVQKVRP